MHSEWLKRAILIWTSNQSDIFQSVYLRLKYVYDNDFYSSQCLWLDGSAVTSEVRGSNPIHLSSNNLNIQISFEKRRIKGKRISFFLRA